MFSWFKEISSTERRTFWACFGGERAAGAVQMAESLGHLQTNRNG